MAQDRDSNDPGAKPIEALLARHNRQDRPALAEIEAHWREIKARSLHLPHRADLDPSRIAGALPHAFVLERAAPGVARLRIVGRALSNLLGTEARQGVFRTPLTGRLLLLPMLDRDGNVTRALGGLVVEGTKRSSIVKFDLAETPSRFQILPQATAAWAVPSSGPLRGLAEPRRPYLRLVVDNS